MTPLPSGPGPEAVALPDAERRPLRVSVAICTWNRAKLLRSTLERLTSLRVPEDVDWEVVVVNNACTDGTDRVIDEYRGRLPLVRLFEPEPGLSNARNAAVGAASGDYIIWTDDDVLVDPEWIAAYAEAFRRWPEVVFFGGPVAPDFEGTPPDWVIAAVGLYEAAFAVRDLGDGPAELDHDRLPFGANMAVRADVQRRFAFDPALGRKGSGMLASEETVLLRALLDRGLEGRWVAEARLRHHIPRARQTLQFMRRFHFGWGQTSALFEAPAQANGRSFLGRPLWAWRQAVEHEVMYWIRRPFTRPEVWLHHLVHASVGWGRLAAAVRRREPAAP